MEPDLKKQLGARVRKARREADLKQEELAEMLGTSQAVISNVENGVSTIDAPDLPKWARALGKPLMYFYADEAQSWQQRALDILSMIPEDRLDFVLHMLKNMALTMHEVDT
ncbi:helix-turn-helix transcriptional regulator [Phototrophicus methaneseepsis]|uniref:Helix-turn-helix transcriptional regulator n=1 Tax=Phototrophicus methaneseepsis TaxID=2710758 RepID=A0A7S8EB36_9CHLR|nr:helix-turn-helix transcriptional regulator [Phototrophicus methaneseepsis]QPC83681.1 helix-turn-helix transcriptional regulator [Phototrophicus methaneseepsis]